MYMQDSGTLRQAYLKGNTLKLSRNCRKDFSEQSYYISYSEKLLYVLKG